MTSRRTRAQLVSASLVSALASLSLGLTSCGGAIKSLDQLRAATAMVIESTGWDDSRVVERTSDPGTIEFLVLDVTDKPVPNVQVRFGLVDVGPNASPADIASAFEAGRVSTVLAEPQGLDVEGEMVAMSVDDFLGKVESSDVTTDLSGKARMKFKTSTRYGAQVAAVVQVKSEEFDGGGYGSVVVRNVPPPPAPKPFKIVEPREWINSATPEASWEAPQNATRYRVIVAKDKACKD